MLEEYMEDTMKYNSADDKAYGLSGAAIGLYVLDGEAYIGCISVEPEKDEAFSFTPDFYFAGNPRVSAKSVWNHLLENYHLCQAMVISDIMCRRIVAGGNDDIPQKEQHLLRKYVFEEGKKSLSLEQDEMERIFNKDYVYLRRIFSHPGVQNVARHFASTLQERKTLMREQVLEILAMLRAL